MTRHQFETRVAIVLLALAAVHAIADVLLVLVLWRIDVRTIRTEPKLTMMQGTLNHLVTHEPPPRRMMMSEP